MKMVSMKRTEAEKDAVEARWDEAPDYSWGMRLSLSQEEIEKLGIKAEVGEMLMMGAMVKVTSMHMSEQDGGSRTGGMELLVTDMGLEPAKREADAGKMYPSMSK